MSDIIAEFIFPDNPNLTADFELNDVSTLPTDYRDLGYKPSINNIELVGNKTLDELGVQPKGNYAFVNDIPDVSDFATKDEIPKLQLITQSNYDDLVNKDANTLYLIEE